MGSKRTKKSKQDLDLFEQNPMKSAERGEVAVRTSNGEGVENGALPAKRKKKSEDLSKKSKKSKKEELPINGETEEATTKKSKLDKPVEKKRETVAWPENDVNELIGRMEEALPEKDEIAYKSRVEKLNWDEVAFKDYSPEECKSTWLSVQKRIRRFRVLKELLKDAKEWINSPKASRKLSKTKKHPDMPRRPLSSYILFYLQKKDEILSENPGLDASDLTKIVGQVFKSLPPEKREAYEKEAALSREEYLTKLKTFFETHPEYEAPDKIKSKVQKVPKAVKAPTEKPQKVVKAKPAGDKKKGRPARVTTERPPAKNQTAFGLYLASETKNQGSDVDKVAFREKCKEQYHQMTDKKKVYWIELAEKDVLRYEEEVKAYKVKYPDFKIQKTRPALTKREKASKERASGKPVKPPNSAYALFSRVMLQSDEIKSVHPKDRMNYIAGKWKNTSEDEQNKFKDQVMNLLEQYKQEYQTYLDSLPQEEREILHQQENKKKKKSKRSNSPVRAKPKKKIVKKQPVKIKFSEPEQPPISACKYFVSQYKGASDPVQAWKALSSEEKKRYEEELVKKKQAYIIEFEKFLKSLSKEELEAFSKSRAQQTQTDDESSDCSSSSGEDEEEAEEEDNDSESD